MQIYSEHAKSVQCCSCRVHTLDLTSDNPKSELSKDIIRTAWNKMFWARNYTEKIKRNADISEIENSWNKYMEATEKWSSEIMIYYISLEAFYSEEKTKILKTDVQPLFGKISVQMAELKYNLSDSIYNYKEQSNKIQSLKDDLNKKLYFFIYEIEE